MSASHLQKFVNDIVMDIEPRYYPPPLIFVPDIPIVEPRQLHYDFNVERKALKDYEKYSLRSLSKRREEVASPPPSPVEVITVASSSKSAVRNMAPDVSGIELETFNTSFAHFSPNGAVYNSMSVGPNSPRVPYNGILQPSRVGILEPSRASSSSSMQMKKEAIKQHVNAFEEFEQTPSLFDLLEMRTIDDKTVLEQVLMANATGSSSSLTGSEQNLSASHSRGGGVPTTLNRNLSQSSLDARTTKLQPNKNLQITYPVWKLSKF